VIDLFEANARVPRQTLPAVNARRAALVAELASSRRRRSRRVLRLVAVAAAVVIPATVALAEAGVPIAFLVLRAADRAPAPGDAIDPVMRGTLETANAQESALAAAGWPATSLDVDQARLVLTASDGSKLYVLSTNDRKLCVLLEHGGDLGHGSDTCLEPLDATQPISATFESATPGRPADVYGVAIDGVVGIEGTFDGFPVSIPVHDNAFYWRSPYPWTKARLADLSAQFADGRTVAVP
jgi:hypothetical protein